MTIDCECDMIENNLSMIQLFKEEKIRKANEIVVYGKSLPTEVWDLIKKFNDWTDERREIRNMMVQHPVNNGYRKGRTAPTVRIGDEIYDGGRICGRVVKIQKASVDIECYAYIGYKRTLIVDDSNRVIDKTTYKWKKNVVEKMRWIGTYQLGDNGGGFVNEKSYYQSRKFESKNYSNERWVMGTDFRIEPHPKDGRWYMDMDNC